MASKKRARFRRTPGSELLFQSRLLNTNRSKRATAMARWYDLEVTSRRSRWHGNTPGSESQGDGNLDVYKIDFHVAAQFGKVLFPIPQGFCLCFCFCRAPVLRFHPHSRRAIGSPGAYRSSSSRGCCHLQSDLGEINLPLRLAGSDDFSQSPERGFSLIFSLLIPFVSMLPRPQVRAAVRTHHL